MNNSAITSNNAGISSRAIITALSITAIQMFFASVTKALTKATNVSGFIDDINRPKAFIIPRIISGRYSAIIFTSISRISPIVSLFSFMPSVKPFKISEAICKPIFKISGKYFLIVFNRFVIKSFTFFLSIFNLIVESITEILCNADSKNAGSFGSVSIKKVRTLSSNFKRLSNAVSGLKSNNFVRLFLNPLNNFFAKLTAFWNTFFIKSPTFAKTFFISSPTFCTTINITASSLSIADPISDPNIWLNICPICEPVCPIS